MKDKEAAFIGKITAGVTHEINNVLASIKEISGLLEDILSLSPQDSFPHKEKFQSALSKIQNQVQRGVKLTTQLNKFSHLPDNKISNLNLNELTEHLIFLTQRFARLKNIELQSQISNNDLTVLTNPLQLQMAIFYSTQYLIDRMNLGGQIRIHPNKNGEHFSIHISCEGDITDKSSIFRDKTSSTELLALQEIIKSLNGNTEFDESIPGILISLTANKKNDHKK